MSELLFLNVENAGTTHEYCNAAGTPQHVPSARRPYIPPHVPSPRAAPKKRRGVGPQEGGGEAGEEGRFCRRLAQWLVCAVTPLPGLRFTRIRQLSFGRLFTAVVPGTLPGRATASAALSGPGNGTAPVSAFGGHEYGSIAVFLHAICSGVLPFELGPSASNELIRAPLEPVTAVRRN